MPKGKSPAKIYLIEAIPITKSAGRGTLSYFSSEKIEPGQMIKVPLRKKEVLAIAMSVRSARDAKSLLRNADFSLKKISKKSILDSFLPKHILSLVDALSRYYATSPGVIWSEILPKFITDKPELLTTIKSKKKNGESDNVSKEPLVLQMEPEERFGQYRSVIRQSFARQRSVLFITPSAEEAEAAYTELSRGISEYTFLVTSKSKKKERESTWKTASEMKHPVVLVSTPISLVFDRPDLETYILERENARSYRSLSRPYLNYKTVLLILARLTKRELVLGDSVLSIESLMREKEGRYGELSPIKWRLSGAQTRLVDMKQPARPLTPERSDGGQARKGAEEEKPFQVFSDELTGLIKKSLGEKKGIFLFGARKGLSPTTVCGDCGVILPCKICGAPVILYKKPARHASQGEAGGGEQSLFVCHRCGEKRDPETTCDNCGSWKLNPIGIGTELIFREARKQFPHANVYLIDKEHTSTKAKVDKVIKDFNENGGILVGTELAVFHLKQVAYSAVVSLDALFSLPDFGAEERIFYLVSRIREITEVESMIQTRNIGKEILAWSAQGNTLDFYKREMQDRQNFSYPPITLFIKVESKDINSLKYEFEKWHPEFMKETMIIRMPRAKWPDKELSEKLSLLPPNFLVKVDPESLI